MAVDSLLTKSLPFGQRLQVSVPSASDLQSHQNSPHTDTSQE
ncbi:hypothetical protein [Sporisorium scitamineum]|uniref:Uncharacterized protein n=1 Tax=Sporisorium scitamineum TaxID=49012 RepID=A0A0F7RS88_9BASI|nr:hypothetical protein [Sporisorium scitamineum]